MAEAYDELAAMKPGYYLDASGDAWVKVEGTAWPICLRFPDEPPSGWGPFKRLYTLDEVIAEFKIDIEGEE